jgi:hypothetical protein
VRGGEYVACMGAERDASIVLVGKPVEKEPLGGPRRKLGDNIEMDLQEINGFMYWIVLAQVKDKWRILVKAVMSFRLPQNVGTFLLASQEGLIIYNNN